MNYSTLALTTVNPLLVKYGQTMTIVRAGPVASGWTKTFSGAEGSFKWTNDDTGVVVYVDPASTVTYTRTSGKGVEKVYKDSEIDGTVILQGDRRIILSSMLSPVVGDYIEIGTDKVRVVSVKRIAPGGVVLLWELQCRE